MSFIKPKEKHLTPTVPGVKSRFSGMGYLSFAFIIPVIIMYLIYIAMEIHPFGNGSVLVLDLNGQYVYFYEALRNFVYGDASLLYSFSRALGGDFMGIYAYYVSSPFSYIVCLFPQTRILEALLAIFLLKTGITGLTFGFYIHKTGKSRSKIATVIFSCIYALTAYAVVQQHNSMWIDAVMWLPIITYGIEQLIKYGRFKMYVFFLALTMLSNFYIGYMVCFWSLAYFFVYYFSYNKSKINNPYSEKFHFIKSFLRFGLFSLLSAGIAAAILLAAYYSLTFGKTEFSNPSWAFNLKFDVIELLVKFLPGSYDTVRPEGLPFVYCGVLTLILIPVYFLSPKFTPREKIMSGALIAFLTLSFTISVADLVWHGFQRPNWLNYRYSFMLCFFLLTLACSAFDEIKSISSKTIFAISTALAALVVFIQTLDLDFVDDLQTIWFSLAAISAYLIILCLLKVTRFREDILLILVFIVVFELFGNGLTNVVDLNSDVVYSNYSGYNDFLAAYRPVLEILEEKDDSFYRYEKTTHRKVNDNMALGIRGLSNSTSTLNADTISFLSRMGYCSKSHWSKYAGGTPVNDSLLGIKYIITTDDLSDYYPSYFEYGGFNVWHNKYALSLAYGVDERVNGIVADIYETPFDYLNALLTAMVGQDETIQVFVPIPVSEIITNDFCAKSFIAGHHKYARTSEEHDANVFYTFIAPNDQEVFFYLPSDYQREVGLKVNGSSAGTFWGGDTDRIISLGSFRDGESVRLTMTLNYIDLYVKNGYNCFFYIDMEAFEAVMSTLSEMQYNIEEYTEHSFEGRLTSPRDNQIIQTSLPYDQGWKIYVDGERIDSFETLDALLAFRVDSGEHEIKMTYMPDMFVIGFIISGACILIFILLIIFEKKLLIKNRELPPAPIIDIGATNAADVDGDIYDYDNPKDDYDPEPPCKADEDYGENLYIAQYYNSPPDFTSDENLQEEQMPKQNLRKFKPRSSYRRELVRGRRNARAKTKK